MRIQRPGVRQQVASDLEAMEDIAEVMQARSYPGLAIILFVAAVAGGVVLIVSIARTDETERKGDDRMGPRHH